MTTKFKTATVESTVWRDGDELTPGVKIKQGRGWSFVPVDQLRAVADAIHDAADAYDEATS